MAPEQGKRKTTQSSNVRGTKSSSTPPSSASKGQGGVQAESRKGAMSTLKPVDSNNSVPKEQYHGRPLEAASILTHPRLQQATGLHPRKLSWWRGVRPPKDELIRLQWAMSLPDRYPAKRPRGNF
ncbi:hypothetical protein GGS26DRAFT_204644 [Hypomontagnella submonticulosa]|nr:hypothetical protein GGS26DRAFT_204644 [Hypomontagnella submonticulosa]